MNCGTDNGFNADGTPHPCPCDQLQREEIKEAIRDELKRRFPWLGTDDENVSGSDVIDDIASLYEDMGGDLKRPEDDDAPDALEYLVRTLLYAQTGRLGAFRTVNYQQA